MSPRYWSAVVEPVSGLQARSMEYLKSWAVTRRLLFWKTTSSRSWGEVVVYWIRQDRADCVTGPPSVSSNPWSTPNRTSGRFRR